MSKQRPPTVGKPYEKPIGAQHYTFFWHVKTREHHTKTEQAGRPPGHPSGLQTWRRWAARREHPRGGGARAELRGGGARNKARDGSVDLCSSSGVRPKGRRVWGRVGCAMYSACGWVWFGHHGVRHGVAGAFEGAADWLD